jgi:hypothetical protein
VSYLSAVRVRPIESLDQLSGFWRFMASLAILAVSFLAVWTAPAWVIISSIVALAIRTGWDWIFWTMRRLVDLLCGLACAQVFLAAELNMPMLGSVILLWASEHLILAVLDRLGEWALNSLTFPLVVNLRLAWWAVRTVLALLWMAVVAVCGAAVAVVTGATNGVRAICSFFLKGCVRAVSYLSAVRVLAAIEFTFVASIVVAYLSWYRAIQVPTAIGLAPVPMVASAIGEGKMLNNSAAFASSMARDLTCNEDAGIFVGAIADQLKADFPRLFDPNFHAALAVDDGQIFGPVMNTRPFAPN